MGGSSGQARTPQLSFQTDLQSLQISLMSAFTCPRVKEDAGFQLPRDSALRDRSRLQITANSPKGKLMHMHYPCETETKRHLGTTTPKKKKIKEILYLEFKRTHGVLKRAPPAKTLSICLRDR